MCSAVGVLLGELFAISSSFRLWAQAAFEPDERIKAPAVESTLPFEEADRLAWRNHQVLRRSRQG